jgi:hypothetical protein
LLTSCASFPGKKLPTIETLPDKSEFMNKPSIYLDVNFFTHLSGAHKKPAENVTAKGIFIETVEQVTKESNLFATYTFDRFKGREMDYIIKLDMTNYGNMGTAMLGGMITGLSLFTIPSRVTDNYKLVANVFDRNGKELGSYEVEDCIRTWFHLFMLPLAGKTPNRTVKHVWTNMLKNIYEAISNDKLLLYSSMQYENRIAYYRRSILRQ